MSNSVFPAGVHTTARYALDATMRVVPGVSPRAAAEDAAKLRATKLYTGLAIQVTGRRLVQVGLFDQAQDIEKKLKEAAAARGERKRENSRSKKRKKIR